MSERGRQQELTLPIDVFFRSLAQDCGARAVAIVLSGGGSDGVTRHRTCARCRRAGTRQDISPAHSSTACRARLSKPASSPIRCRLSTCRAYLLEYARRQSNAAPAVERDRPAPTGLEALYRVLETEFGIDFTHYKPSTVTRRIERRLALAQAPTIEEYLARLRSEREELDTLYRDLLIGVTRFFRDPAAFALLEERILPELLARASRDTPLRLWVAGCATGEEAYSLAIVLQELMAIHGERPVKIFATDVHRGSLEQAALGMYGEEAVSNVSPERLARYFSQNGGTYQVVPELRQMIVFAQHNVISDAPFTRVDLVTCRNLLIYLQPPAQQRILSLFHFALTHGGVLFLGPSGEPWTSRRRVRDRRQALAAVSEGREVRMPVDPRRPPVLTLDTRVATPPAPPGARHSLGQLLSVYDVLLEEALPPSLLLNERGELVHALGGAARFLRVRDGRQSLDVQDWSTPTSR